MKICRIKLFSFQWEIPIGFVTKDLYRDCKREGQTDKQTSRLADRKTERLLKSKMFIIEGDSYFIERIYCNVDIEL